jgi:hypothetical protein
LRPLEEIVVSLALDDWTDDELNRLYAAAEDRPWARRLVVAESESRDKADAARRKRSEIDRARWARAVAEWEVAAHAQFLQAEEACRGGGLLNRCANGQCPTGYDRDGEKCAHGIRPVPDPETLWSGPWRFAERRASEELLEFWASQASNGDPERGRTPTASAFGEMYKHAHRDEDA